MDTRRSEPELYVADRGNNRIQVMTLDGKHKRFLKDEMKQPCCFYQFKDYLVIPDLQARVTIYDKNDKPAAILGDDPEAPKTAGWPNIQDKIKPGYFSSPHAACVDSHEDIYVVEWILDGSDNQIETDQITVLARKDRTMRENAKTAVVDFYSLFHQFFFPLIVRGIGGFFFGSFEFGKGTNKSRRSLSAPVFPPPPVLTPPTFLLAQTDE